jgi:hypothetical protein
MKGIYNYFSISKVYKNYEDVEYQAESILFHGTQNEERSNISLGNSKIEVSIIEELENQEINILVDTINEKISLRSLNDSKKLTHALEGRSVYLDITSLTHSTWAWVVKSLLLRDKGDTFVLYSEPLEYKFHDNPVDGQIFDLSNKIAGIAPIPGFLKLGTYTPDNFIFMPLLGFEGTRLSHIIEDVQPLPDQTFPVFGVPGFRYDFPFHSYHGNKNVLERDGIWRNMRYEQANCPASIYVLGLELLNENPYKTLRIAPIGTKPHALGAILLKLIYPERVDLIYDHPIRQNKRTHGRSNTICYRLNPFKEKIKK